MGRFHYGLRSLMAVPIFAGLVLWLLGSVEGCGGRWARGIGFKNIPLDFLVIDAGDGRPIPSAKIRLIEKDPETVLTTGRDGHTGFLFRNAPVASTRYYPLIGSPGKETLAVNYSWALSVRAEGYDDQLVEMSDLTKDPHYHYDAVPPAIVVRLARRATKP
jgi:hypothetical protein